jgi:hypothetical protein
MSWSGIQLVCCRVCRPFIAPLVHAAYLSIADVPTFLRVVARQPETRADYTAPRRLSVQIECGDQSDEQRGIKASHSSRLETPRQRNGMSGARQKGVGRDGFGSASRKAPSMFQLPLDLRLAGRAVVAGAAQI